MPGPLAGITVIDFTEYIAGPYCTMMLADMGADVIKVEKPEGDAWRHTAPVAPYEGRGFLGVNRGKRSIALDLDARRRGRSPRAACSPPPTSSCSTTVPASPSASASTTRPSRRENPRLIYCENTAFGREGPYADRPGFDILSQAATGMILYENKIEHGVPGYISTLAVADLTIGDVHGVRDRHRALPAQRRPAPASASRPACSRPGSPRSTGRCSRSRTSISLCAMASSASWPSGARTASATRTR